MLENKKVGNREAHMSRYIASWRYTKGDICFGYGVEFEGWLMSEGLTEQEAKDCAWIAACGEVELVKSAERYIKEHWDEWMKELEELEEDDD